jgi:hypothetical protein
VTCVPKLSQSDFGVLGCFHSGTFKHTFIFMARPINKWVFLCVFVCVCVCVFFYNDVSLHLLFVCFQDPFVPRNFHKMFKGVC